MNYRYHFHLSNNVFEIYSCCDYMGNKNPWAISRMKSVRNLALIIAIIFFFFSSGCSHPPKQPSTPLPWIKTSSQMDTVYYHSPEKEKWWQKDEYQYLILVLIILGIAIASGAAVVYTSGP